MTDPIKFIMEKQFDAPIDLVWACWTKPEYLSRWFGPRVETIVHAFDLSPGGVWLNEMKGDNYAARSRIVFQTVDPPHRLVWHNSSADENWEITSSPMMPDWPRTMEMQAEFEARDGGTLLTLTWQPFNPTDAERACFEGAVENLGKGWGMGMSILEDLLAELQS